MDTLDALLESNLVIWMRFSLENLLQRQVKDEKSCKQWIWEMYWKTMFFLWFLKVFRPAGNSFFDRFKKTEKWKATLNVFFQILAKKKAKK